MNSLRIKALALGLGYAESMRASTLIVHWRGTPFTDARRAVESFYDACRAAIVAPAPKRAACCQAMLGANPRAKACPDCGASFATKRRGLPMDAYLARLASMECDGSGEVLYPHGNAPSAVENGESVLGQWSFFDGFPEDGDVVEVTRADRPFVEAGAGPARYHVIHVGKRAAVEGEIPVETGRTR